MAHPTVSGDGDTGLAEAARPGVRAQRACSAVAAERRRRGFTLLELMVVMALIVVIAGIAMASYRNSTTLAQEAVLAEDLYRMRDAIDQNYADRNKYPATLDALVSEGYLRSIPVDPFTRESTTWQEIPAEPDPNNPAGATGVYDVKSGSDRVSMKGTPYNEW